MLAKDHSFEDVGISSEMIDTGVERLNDLLQAGTSSAYVVSEVYLAMQSGASGSEIEITSEMTEAGERAIWSALSGSIPHPSFCAADLAKAVFAEMFRIHLASKSGSKR